MKKVLLFLLLIPLSIFAQSPLPTINLGIGSAIKTPINSGPETILPFDNMEIKWHNSSASPLAYDGIAIRVTSGTASINYSVFETYIANAVADAGRSLWGSDNTYYNLPMASAVANLSNTVYPYAFNISTTFTGIGNPALPNSSYRVYLVTNNTSGQRYRIATVKKASTGEVFAAQNGICDIIVEKI